MDELEITEDHSRDAEQAHVDAAGEGEAAGEPLCARARLMRLSGLGGGALFVLVPNSELIHAGIRALLGVGGYECC